MPVSQKVGRDEKIGFSIKSSERSKDKAGNRTYVTDQLLGHVKNRDRMSMDRISIAEENEDFDKVLDAAKSKSRIPECDRFFRGWQTFRVARLRNSRFTVQGSTDPANPTYEYHADVVVPANILNDRPKKEKAIRELVNKRCWRAYPQPI